jgi:periplasmic divalent cation tolerance protein
MSDTGICEVIITGPTGNLLANLARDLVAERLAASANAFATAVDATYWWQGEIQTATETRIHLLTRVELVDRVISFVRERHPYNVPNITAVPIIAGNPDFIAWVKNETLASSPAT